MLANTPNLIEGIRPEKIVLDQSAVTVQSGYAMKPTWKVLPSNTPLMMKVSVEAGMKAVAKSGGWVVGIEQNSTTNVFVRSEYIYSVKDSFTMTIKPTPKATNIDIPKTITIKERPKTGAFSPYAYFVMEVGLTYGGTCHVTYENRDLYFTTKSADTSIVTVGRGGTLCKFVKHVLHN